jgi:hypothetical protein
MSLLELPKLEFPMFVVSKALKEYNTVKEGWEALWVKYSKIGETLAFRRDAAGSVVYWSDHQQYRGKPAREVST